MNENAMVIRGLAKQFSRGTLGPLDLTVPKSAISSFIRPNGAGKSTTIDLVMPEVGRLSIKGNQSGASRAHSKALRAESGLVMLRGQLSQKSKPMKLGERTQQNFPHSPVFLVSSWFSSFSPSCTSCLRGEQHFQSHTQPPWSF